MQGGTATLRPRGWCLYLMGDREAVCHDLEVKRGEPPQRDGGSSRRGMRMRSKIHALYGVLIEQGPALSPEFGA